MSNRKQIFIFFTLIILGIAVVGYGIYLLMSNKTISKKVASPNAKIEQATFAGGCFWCMEPPFEKINGVLEVISGYSGGEEANPTYEEVSAGSTGHAESIQITYDANQISYDDLLEIFWRQIDPTDAGGQFVDRGYQYRSAIFYHDEEQKKSAENSKLKLEQSGRFDKPVITEISPFKKFYDAEEYHQDYYKKSSVKYKYYRYRSGRDQFLDKTWEDDREVEIGQNNNYTNFTKPDNDKLEEILSDLQFKVTQKDGTEKAFDNEYWDNKKEGIYVDIVSGEPLFSSKDKYVSGTGWPSFTKPIDSQYIVEKADWGILGKRTEIRSKYADSHLGHVFNDGPEPSGLRYCMNSAAMKFIPRENMEEAGYGDYLSIFE